MNNDDLTELLEDMMTLLEDYRDDDDTADELFWRTAATLRELRKDQHYVNRAI